MINKAQLKIFSIFGKNPFGEYTRAYIKKELGEKSNNFLSLSINLLKKENVLVEKRIGRTGILSLNLENDLTFFYLGLYNYFSLKPEIRVILSFIRDNLFKETPFFSIVIFGSYAEKNQKNDSDLDIAIFIENKVKINKIKAIMNSVSLKTPIDLDFYVIPKDEMIEMLKNDEENLGKQIARKHLAVYNLNIFYQILKEGMKNGFRI